MHFKKKDTENDIELTISCLLNTNLNKKKNYLKNTIQ